MRLGSKTFVVDTEDELEPLTEIMDRYGLSALPAPRTLVDMTIDESIAFGEKARSLGFVIGEAVARFNLMSADQDRRSQRIETIRRMLVNADAMGCKCVFSLMGSTDASDSYLVPSSFMYSLAGRQDCRETVLRILDGLDLKTTRMAIEPFYTSFFYQPEDIADFLTELNHPSFGLLLDQANTLSSQNYFDTTSLIERTHRLIAKYIVSVHLKEIAYEPGPCMRLRDVHIGEGSMDHATQLRHVAQLHPDITCFCELFTSEADYAMNFARLHQIAGKQGLAFLPRRQ